ncbi:MAG: hypothetical protein A2Y40_02475 [Candidatus Margulisbacteria bacterium GWF2_35_9]|nr:MAG: hypothetical protein A2Y40_02475 [Candidatus Margulisbacteria bacterium GWF2_35_9]
MSDIQELIQRRNNIKSVQEITDAMQIIATIMIGKAQKLLNYRKKIQPYYDRLFFTRHIDELEKSKNSEKWLIAFFSEKGFCGGYNSQLVPFLLAHKETKNIIIVGDKGRAICRKHRIKYTAFYNSSSRVPHETIVYDIFETFKKNNFPWDVKVVINKYNNMFSQVPKVVDFFPVHEEIYRNIEATVDMSLGVINQIILEKYIRDRLFYFFIQNYTGETAAKLLMMKSAVDNAEKLGEELGKDIQKARQHQITQDLSEIIGAYKVLSS